MSASTTKTRGQRSKPGSESNSISASDFAAKFDDGAEIDAAMAQAVRDAVLFHKKMGNPIAEWDEVQKKVVWIQPEDI